MLERRLGSPGNSTGPPSRPSFEPWGLCPPVLVHSTAGPSPSSRWDWGGVHSLPLCLPLLLGVPPPVLSRSPVTERLGSKADAKRCVPGPLPHHSREACTCPPWALLSPSNPSPTHTLCPRRPPTSPGQPGGSTPGHLPPWLLGPDLGSLAPQQPQTFLSQSGGWDVLSSRKHIGVLGAELWPLTCCCWPSPHFPPGKWDSPGRASPPAAQG